MDKKKLREKIKTLSGIFVPPPRKKEKVIPLRTNWKKIKVVKLLGR